MIEKIESEWVSAGAGCREATQGWIPAIVENLPLVSSLPSSRPRVVEFERTLTVSPGLIVLIFPNLFPQLFQRTQKWPAGIWKLSFSTSGTTEQLIGFSVVFYRWVDSCQVLFMCMASGCQSCPDGLTCAAGGGFALGICCMKWWTISLTVTRKRFLGWS